MGEQRYDAVKRFLDELKDGHHPVSDGELLGRFVLHQDQAAFAMLVNRHGPLVRRVCRRVGLDEHDSDDAFQATFLVLSQKASTLRKNPALGAFLFKVAHRFALQICRREGRRHLHESAAAAIERGQRKHGVGDDLSLREAQRLLEDELAALPDQYRIPLVLHNLQGKTQEEIAEELHMQRRTVGRRIEQARQLLQKRLENRGIEMSGVLLILLLGKAEGAVPPALLASTLRVVASFTTAKLVLGASPASAKLALAMLRASAAARFKVGLLVMSTFFVLAGGAVLAWHSATPKNEGGKNKEIAIEPRSRPLLDHYKQRPVAAIAGRVLDASGTPISHADVTALARRRFGPGEQGIHDEVLAEGRADAKGEFTLSFPADFPTWLTDRQVALLASAPGRPPATMIVSITEQGASGVNLKLVDTPVPIRGRLLDPDGSPAAGIRLQVVHLGDVAREPVQGIAGGSRLDRSWPGPFLSGAQGRFELTGIDPAMGAWLQVDDERFAPDSFKVKSTQDETAIRLKPAHVIQGQVNAADSGLLLPGIKLTARDLQFTKYSRHTVSGYQGKSSRTDAVGPIDGVTRSDGSFRLRAPSGSKTVVEIHPPTNSPYLAIRKEVSWSEGIVRQVMAVTLPRGVVVRGRVEDEKGVAVSGAAIAFRSYAQGNSFFRPELIQGRERIVVSDLDGRFVLAAPPGPVALQAYGPSHAYRAQPMRYWSLLDGDEEIGRWGWREPLPSERRYYLHAETDLHLSVSADPTEVHLRLTHGQTVTGRVFAPNGQLVKSAVLLSGDKVSPVRPGSMLPLSISNGRYELPGCVSEKTYPVFVLDPVNQLAGSADIKAGQEGSDIHLAPCGSARVRVIDGTGKPAPSRGFILMLWAERSFFSDHPPPSREADDHYASWYDPLHYGEFPTKTDDDGWMVLPGLIPSARYHLVDIQSHQSLSAFVVTAGETKHLTDIVLPVSKPDSSVEE